MENLRQSITAILFRDSRMITKYERKLITHIRSACLCWVASTNFLQSKTINGKILNSQQVLIVLWHFAIDEDV